MSATRLSFRRWHCGFLGVVVALLAAPCLFAQESPIANRLPPNTIGYVQWRGNSFLSDAHKKNHLLQLLQDPDFAAITKGLAMNIPSMKNTPGAAGLLLGAPAVLSLLENPAAAGIVTNPMPLKTSAPGKPARIGFFLVYDAAGKADLIEEAETLFRAGIKDAGSATSYDFGGTKVEVRTEKATAGYRARTARYYLYADQKYLIEDLIARFGGAGEPATSIARTGEYREMRKYLGPDAAIEYFVRVPALTALIPSDPQDQRTANVLRALHVERIHAMGGSVSFAGEATRFRGAILGDTAPGSLFDIVGASTATFATQPLAGTGPSFQAFRIDLPAIYHLSEGAAAAALPPQQAASITGIESMARGFLGMPIQDMLALFTGEDATATSYSEEGASQQLIALTIQKPNDVLRVLRSVLGRVTLAENTSGGATYLDIGYPYKDPATGTQRKKLYYVAVTPEMALVAPRKAMLSDAIQRLSSSSGGAVAGTLFANPEYLRVRALLPQKLSGLGANDLTEIPWDKCLENYANQIEQAVKQSKNSHPPDLSFLRSVKLDFIPRHLHMSAGGWWKDSSGVYFDSYLQ